MMIQSTYVIIPVNEITDQMVSESVNEPDTLRYNNDKTKAILKFCTNFPSSVQGYTKYSHEGIIELLNSIEWQNNIN